VELVVEVVEEVVELVVEEVVELVVEEVVEEVVELVVVEVGGVHVTQNTLCFTSAPTAPAALTVSLRCQPCSGCWAYPANRPAKSYSASLSRSVPPPAASSPINTVSVRIGSKGPVGG
jgi:hypothetical protein